MSRKRICVVLICIGYQLVIRAQDSFDSLGAKLPRHYFNTVVSLDFYRKPGVGLDTLKKISRKLGTYGIRQTSLNFYTPLHTRVRTRHDGTLHSTHFLLTFNYLSLTPEFSNIPDHNLVKIGLGLRFIYNTGRKGVLFAEAAPFVTRDATYRSEAFRRFASTLIYSVNESTRFNWRVGITKSFMWGNRYYLPYLGVRFGALDKFNVSIQLPRSITVTWPVSRKFILSMYTRPQGGMYLFSNRDTIYPLIAEKTFHFTQYEIITGLRADVRFGTFAALFLSSGFSTGNFITFYAERSNPRLGGLPYYRFFYEQRTRPTAFVLAGVVFRFGKTRSISKDRNLYDAIDLNNSGNGNIQIPVEARKQAKENMRSVEDLIDYNDL